MSAEGIEEVAVSGKAAGACADDCGSRLSAAGGFDSQLADFLSHILQVGRDEVSAGKFAAAECHPATAMCVCQGDEDAVGIEACGSGDVCGEILLQAGFEDAVIE